MNPLPAQGELFGLVWRACPQTRRLRVNDIIRVNDRLCWVMRVSDCAAVVLMNQPLREFSTRFDKRVRFQPSPLTFRISPNSEMKILNRNTRKKPQQH